MTYVGQDIRPYNDTPALPQSQLLAQLSRQLPGRVVVEANTGQEGRPVGAYGVPLRALSPDYLNTDPGAARPWLRTRQLQANVANPFKGLVPNSGSLNGSTVRKEYLLRSNPQYMHFTNVYTP